MNQMEALTLLDRLDAYRRNCSNSRYAPGADYALRMAAAMIAEQAGFHSRTDWTELLRADRSSAYHKALYAPAVVQHAPAAGARPVLVPVMRKPCL